MTTEQKLERLKDLYLEADALRTELDISPPGSELFHADVGDSEIVVLANGLGEAVTMEIEGLWPSDYHIIRLVTNSEEEAVSIAARWAQLETNEEDSSDPRPVSDTGQVVRPGLEGDRDDSTPDPPVVQARREITDIPPII